MPPGPRDRGGPAVRVPPLPSQPGGDAPVPRVLLPDPARGHDLPGALQGTGRSCSGTGPADGRGGGESASAKGWGASPVCVLAGCGGVYYAFFSCYLLLVAGLGGSLRRRRASPFWSAGILVTVIGLGVLGNLSPKVVYGTRHGPNPEAVRRHWTHTEVLGLRLAELLLPVSEHRVRPLARLREQYDRAQPLLAQENRSSALGAVGERGIPDPGGRPPLARAVRGRRDSGRALSSERRGVVARDGRRLRAPARFRGHAPDPRVQPDQRVHRLLLALRRGPRPGPPLPARPVQGPPVARQIGLGVLLLAEYLDQSPAAFVPPYDEIRREFANDAEFGARWVEGILPPRPWSSSCPSPSFPKGCRSGG